MLVAGPSQPVIPWRFRMRLGCGCSVTCFAIATPTVKRLMFGPESAIVMDDWFSQPSPSVTLNVRYAAVAPLSAVALYLQ